MMLAFAVSVTVPSGSPLRAEERTAVRRHSLEHLGEPWRWVHFNAESGLPSDSVLDVAESADGDTWAYTTKGVAFYDGFEWREAAGPHLGCDGENRYLQGGAGFVPGPTGRLWLICHGKLFRCVDGRVEAVPMRNLDNPNIRSAAELPDGRLVMADTSRFYIWDEGSLTPVPGPMDREMDDRTDRLDAVDATGEPDVAGQVDEAGEGAPGPGAGIRDIGVRDPGVRDIGDRDTGVRDIGVSADDRTDLNAATDGWNRKRTGARDLTLIPSRAGTVRMWTWQGIYRFRPEDNGWEPEFREHGELRYGWCVEDPAGYRITQVARNRGTRILLTQNPDGTEEEIVDGFGDYVAMEILPGGDAIVVYGTGVARVRIDGRWSAINHMNATLASVQAIRFTPSGRLWVGNQSGLHMFKTTNTRWAYLQERDPDAGSDVTDILQAQDGTIWAVGGRKIGAYHTDRSVTVYEPYDDATDVATTVAEDDAGNIWVGGVFAEPGLYRFDGRKWAKVGSKHGFQADMVHRIRRDDEGRLWFLCLDYVQPEVGPTGPGPYILENGTFRRWEHTDELPSGRVYDRIDTTDGAMWFATYAGISRFDLGRWRHWGVDDGLKTGPVYSLAEDANGRVWFGHRNDGIGRITAADRVEYVPDQSMIGNQVWDINSDDRHRLWMTTSTGLWCRDEFGWRQFDQGDGLRTTSLWPVMPLEDSVLIGSFGTGPIVLNLAEQHAPPPRFRFDEPVIEHLTAKLNWNVLPYYSDASMDDFRYRYRLDDGPWSVWQRGRDVTLINLSLGGHRLAVQARSLFGVVTSGHDVLPFVVPRPASERVILAAAGAGTVASLFLVVALIRRKRRERALRRSADLASARADEQQMLLENTQDFLYRYSRAGALEYISPSVERVLGYAPEEFRAVNRKCMTDHPVNRSVAAKTEKILREGGDAPPYRVEVYAADGRRVMLEVSECAYMLRNEIAGIIGIARDVTERYVAEEQLKDAKEQAETASRAKSIFLANVSHEIRTPIMAMLGAAEVGEVDHSSQAREIILRNGRYLLSLINGVLDTARFEAGFLPMNQRRCDTSELVNDIMAAIPPIQPDGTVRFEFDCDEPLPSTIVTDRTRMAQAVLNLVSNALKFTREGLVRVAIRVEDAGNGHEFVVTVEDTGSGIAAEHHEEIFDIFVQLPAAQKDVGHGVGLGLPLSRSIARQLGGDITVDSAPGKGSTFQLRVPVAPVEEPWQVVRLESDVPGPREPVPVTRRLEGTLLLAEDFADTREIMCMGLEQAGVEVTAVADGAAAVEAAESRHFDMILMDVRMPGVDGVEATRMIRARGIRTPIIAMTASADTVERQRLLDVGFDDLWPKPISISDLLENVGKLLPTKKSASKVSAFTDARLAAVVVRFGESLPQRCRDIVDAVSDDDLATARDALHQLVGSAGIHGFDRVSHAAAKALEQARRGKLSPSSAVLGELLSAADEGVWQ